METELHPVQRSSFLMEKAVGVPVGGAVRSLYSFIVDTATFLTPHRHFANRVVGAAYNGMGYKSHVVLRRNIARVQPGVHLSSEVNN